MKRWTYGFAALAVTAILAAAPPAKAGTSVGVHIQVGDPYRGGSLVFHKEPDLVGYEIVWRDTTAAVWTNSRTVGKVTTFTMKGMSKDNYFFGVRAVDRQGNRSPVTYPRPAARSTPTPRLSSRPVLP